MAAPASTYTPLPPGMVAVPVRVEQESDRFIRGLVNEPDDFPRRAGKIGVDHQHVVVEDDPGAIGRLLALVVALPEEDARRQFAHGGFLAARGHKDQRGKDGHERHAPCDAGDFRHDAQNESRIDRSMRRLYACELKPPPGPPPKE